MARSRTPTGRLLGPVKTALQLAPPSVLLKAPAVPVPAYTVEGTLGSNGQGADNGRVQSCIDDAPTLPAVGALEDGAARPRLGIGKPRGACVEGGRGQGTGHQGADVETGQPRVDGAPSDPGVGALEDATAVRSCVQSGGGLGVDRQGGDKDKPRFGEPRGVPTATAVSALEDGVGGARVEDGRGLGVDPQ